MKKVLSLLLVCTMIFSLAAFSVSAAGEVYKVTNGTINANHGRFYINVAVPADASASYSSGYVTIKYDTSKVTLWKQYKVEEENEDGDMVEVTKYKEYDEGDFAVYRNSSAKVSEVAKVADGTLAVSWMNTNKIAAGSDIFRIYFTAIDKAGDNFDENTFTVMSSADAETSYGLKNGGAYAFDANNAGLNVNSNDAIDWAYTNADVEVGGGDSGEGDDDGEDDPVYTWGAATDVTADDKDVTGTKVAVFGKVSGGDGKVLADGEYWVTFGQNTYYGKASTSAVTAWAIVIYDPNGTKVEAGRTYGYTAGMTGVPSWTGSVTASAVAAE